MCNSGMMENKVESTKNRGGVYMYMSIDIYIYIYIGILWASGDITPIMENGKENVI